MWRPWKATDALKIESVEDLHVAGFRDVGGQQPDHVVVAQAS